MTVTQLLKLKVVPCTSFLSSSEDFCTRFLESHTVDSHAAENRTKFKVTNNSYNVEIKCLNKLFLLGYNFIC